MALPGTHRWVYGGIAALTAGRTLIGAGNDVMWCWDEGTGNRVFDLYDSNAQPITEIPLSNSAWVKAGVPKTVTLPLFSVRDGAVRVPGNDADAIRNALLALAPTDAAVAALLADSGSASRAAANAVYAPVAEPVATAGLALKVDKAGVDIKIGTGAMAAMTASNYNVALGYGAMEFGTISRENIAVGTQALRNVSAYTHLYDQAHLEGTRNTSIGGGSLYFLTSGYSNIAIGRNAGACQVSGNGLVAIGSGAMVGAAPTGLSNQIENWAPFGTVPSDTVFTVAIGRSALGQASALNNVAIGGGALALSKLSDYNTAVGAQALTALDTGTGTKGGTYTVKGITGSYSQTGTTITLTANSHGLAIGDLAYIQLTSGLAQTLQNDVARAYVASVPTSNTFTVPSPLSWTTTGTAVLVGAESAAAATKNNSNTAVGRAAGYSALTSVDAAILGTNALYTATAITDSTAVGQGALFAADSATNCTAVGQFAARFLTGAANSVTAIGMTALLKDTTGASLTNAAWTNITGLGYDSRVSGADQVQLGNSATTTYVYGTVQNRSDVRDKADVRDTALGLEFIEALRPVDYRWDMREDYVDDDGEPAPRDGSKKRQRFHHGLIAQEVKETIDGLGVDFGGYQDHAVAGGAEVMTIGYDELIAPLIKAVQQLSARVAELEA